MRVIFLIIIVLGFGCKNSHYKYNTKKDDNLTKFDTLTSDKYHWLFHVTPNNEIFFLKEENKLYVNGKIIGNVPSAFGAETFSIIKDYLAFEFIDSNYHDIINIYNLNDFSLKCKLVNYHISDEVYEANQLIVNTTNELFKLGVFDVQMDSIIHEFGENENYPIVFNKRIFCYNAAVKPKDGGKLVIKEYNMNTFDMKGEFVLPYIDSWKVLFILNEKKCVTEVLDKILLVESSGKVISEWPILVGNNYKATINNDTLYLYNWLNKNTDDGEEYFFVRQKICLTK